VDDLSTGLVSILLEKALENTEKSERLGFVEKLFSTLPPQAQQDFLLKLTRLLLESGTPALELGGTLAPIFICAENDCEATVQVSDRVNFAPGQMCCQALNGFAIAKEANEGQINEIAQMFNGLADGTRLKIVKLLSKGEFTVEELVEFLGLPQSTTSHHLRVLKDANMVRGEKRGRNTWYSLVPGDNPNAPASSSTRS